MNQQLTTGDFNMEDNLQDKTPGPGGCAASIVCVIGIVLGGIIAFALWMYG